MLDDGWFRRPPRRHARGSATGTWTPTVWPDGLRPLAEHVRGLGMEFGLWVEPEMVNLDSDLVRAHPDWVLGRPGRRGAGPPRRGQQRARHRPTGRPTTTCCERLDALVDRVSASTTSSGTTTATCTSRSAGATAGAGPACTSRPRRVPAARRRCARRHPGLEIESCASGGARVDLGILERTDRVWASDCNDALERQAIQRWTGAAAAARADRQPTSGRPSRTPRGAPRRCRSGALTALFGHAGIEWDLTSARGAGASSRLAAWVALYKELRPLLHTGDVVRADHPDAGALLHGVVSADRRHAVFAFVRLATSAESAGGRITSPAWSPR